MDRRKFLATIGTGTAAALAIPKVTFGQSRNPDRIITLDSPGAKIIRIFKNGHQVGCVYWVNVDTKQYRRTALWMDFAYGGPWEGSGRIVRHPSMSDRTKISFGHLHKADAEQGGFVHLLPQDHTYPIDQYPVVSYRGQGPIQWDPKANK